MAKMPNSRSFFFFSFFFAFLHFCIFPRDRLPIAVTGEAAQSIQSIELLTGRHLLAPAFLEARVDG